ncbi:triple tyrosine motif-containing protein, partial [Enterococcus faecalis]|uniref:triple tyrosine motif-containing protein n=1 Tax=Enterococcus faecalis TaxID=1351 RepID=UPI00403F8656
VRFRYRLDGVDADWVDAGNRRQAFYTRLGPGHYVFRVIAANNDGVWNDRGTQIAVTIAPTFLQSRLFMVLCSLVGAALLWLAYSLRMRQLGARLRT